MSIQVSLTNDSHLKWEEKKKDWGKHYDSSKFNRVDLAVIFTYLTLARFSDHGITRWVDRFRSIHSTLIVSKRLLTSLCMSHARSRHSPDFFVEWSASLSDCMSLETKTSLCLISIYSFYWFFKKEKSDWWMHGLIYFRSIAGNGSFPLSTRKSSTISRNNLLCLSLPLPSIVEGSLHCFSLQPLSVLIQSDFESNESILSLSSLFWSESINGKFHTAVAWVCVCARAKERKVNKPISCFIRMAATILIVDDSFLSLCSHSPRYLSDDGRVNERERTRENDKKNYRPL